MLRSALNLHGLVYGISYSLYILQIIMKLCYYFRSCTLMLILSYSLYTLFFTMILHFILAM